MYVVLFSGNVMSSPELVFEGVTFVLSFLIIQFLGKKKREKKNSEIAEAAM